MDCLKLKLATWRVSTRPAGMGRDVTPAPMSGTYAYGGPETLYTQHNRSTAIFTTSFAETCTDGVCSIISLRVSYTPPPRLLWGVGGPPGHTRRSCVRHGLMAAARPSRRSKDSWNPVPTTSKCPDLQSPKK